MPTFEKLWKELRESIETEVYYYEQDGAYFKQYSDGIPRPKESFLGFSRKAFDDAFTRLSKFFKQRSGPHV